MFYDIFAVADISFHLTYSHNLPLILTGKDLFKLLTH